MAFSPFGLDGGLIPSSPQAQPLQEDVGWPGGPAFGTSTKLTRGTVAARMGDTPCLTPLA